MTVYVDDVYQYPMGQFGRMKMSHMMADTNEELHEMAAKIGVARKWCQHEEAGKGYIHYDIAKNKRNLAIQFGAKAITLREMSAMAIKWRSTCQKCEGKGAFYDDYGAPVICSCMDK